MKTALKNSWWVQLPSMVLLVALLVIPAARRPWPQRVPVHFDAAWHADRWGSPWEGMVFVLVAPIPLSAGLFVNALWVRQERGRKRFNFAVPLVALPLGFLAGIGCWYWWHIHQLAQAGGAAGVWW